MIKLPTAASLPTARAPNLSQEISADSQASQAAFGLAATGAQVVSQQVDEYNKQQMNEAFSKANNVMHDFDTQHAGKEFYSGDEIPEGVDVRTTETVIGPDGVEEEQIRQRIPAYEVQSQIRDRHQRKAIEAAAMDIRSPSGRSQFTAQMTERANAQNVKMVEHSRQEQNKQIRQQQTMELETALLDRDYETASYVANNFQGSETERQELTKKVSYFAESDTYNDVMSEENLAGIDRSIAVLEKDGYAGNLNEVQRLATLNQLRSKRSQITAKHTKAAEGSATILGIEIDRTIDALESGQDVPASHLSRLWTKAEEAHKAGLASGTTWEKRMYFFAEANGYASDLVDFRTKPPQEQEEIIRNMESGAETGADKHKLDVYKKSHQEAKTMLKSDPISYASKTGVVDVEPMDFSSPAAMVASLNERKGARANVGVTFGPNAGNKFFTKQELDDFTYMMDNASVEDKMGMLQTITTTLDSTSATAVLSQLSGGRSAKYAVAGDLMNDGHIEASRSVLRGEKVLKDNPDIVKAWDSMAAPRLHQKLGNAFATSPRTNGAVMESVRLAYADRAFRAGVRPDIIDVDVLDKAIEDVAGNVVEYNGANIALPDRDMKSGEFDSWLRDIDKGYIKDQGGVRNYMGEGGNELLKSQMRNGEITLQNVGKDKYLLWSEDDGYLVNDRDGNRFILQYNPDATLGSKW